jgi:uncharacterized protein HemX
MMSFFREQKLLASVLILSLLVLGMGLFMIQLTKEQPTAETEQQFTDDQEKTVAVMNLMAEVAEQELKTQKGQSSMQGVMDVKPQESIDRVAALNGRVPEVGSDDWCEVMMVKDAKDWTLDEQSLFAKHCL